MTERILRATHLAKSYRTRKVVDDLSLEVHPGEIVGLLGPNGAGKTTLIKQILRDLKPTSGTVTIFGVDPFKSPVPAKRRIGVIPQNVSLFPALSVL